MPLHFIHEKYNVPLSELKEELGACVTYKESATADTTKTFLTPMMARLVRAHHRVHPELTFDTTGFYSNGGEFRAVRDIRFLHEGQSVGFIRAVFDTEDALEFHNPKIANDTRRGKRKTKSYNAAIKILGTYFVPFTSVSKYEKDRESMRDVIRKLRSHKALATREFEKFAANWLAPMFRNSYEFFNDLFKAHGVSDQALERMWESLQQMRLLSEVDKEAVYVHQHKGTYVLCRADTLIAQYPCDKIPRRLAEKLGKLKLVDPEVFVYDAGFKFNENHFMVVGGYDDV